MSLTQEQLLEAKRDPFGVSRSHVAETLRAGGLREGSVAMIMDGMDSASKIEPGVVSVSPNRPDPFVQTYLPDPENNQALKLKAQLESDKPPTMTVMVNADKRLERLDLNAIETKRYLESSLSVRKTMESRKLRETRLARAVDAASAIVREHDGYVTAEVPVSAQVDLHTFGAIADIYKAQPFIREGFIAEAKQQLAQLRESPYDDIVERPYSFADHDRGNRLQYGPNAQQMYLSDIWDEQAKVAYTFAHDPVAKQGIKIITGFVLGRGVRIRCKNKQVQAIVDEFSGRIKFGRRLKRWTTSAGRDGELFLYVFPIGNGRSDVRALEPRSIWEVVTEAENVSVPISYVQRYVTRFQLFAPTDLQMHYISREYDASEVIHLKLNTTDSEVRGRSDMYTNLVWHKLFRDYWFDQVNKEKAIASYFLTAQVDGNAADLAAIAASMPKGEPEPGSTIVTNSKVKVDIMTPSVSNSAGAGSVYEGLINVIAMGYGFSKLYLGADGSRSRAGASTQAEPSEKAMEERQDEIGEMIDDLVRRVITNAVVGGMLLGVKPDELYDFSVQFPAILKSDSGQYLTNLATGRENGFISNQTAAGLWGDEMEIDNYDYDTERQLIKLEAAVGIDLPPLPGSAPGGALDDGSDSGDGSPTPTVPKPIAPTAPKKPNIHDPTPSAGKAAIKKADRQALDAAIDLITSNGGIVIREH